MRQPLTEFTAQLKKFESRATRLSSLALKDPEQDTDERAGMTLLVSGSLEFFLKELTRVYVAEVSARGAAFEALPLTMQRAHFEEGARVLLHVAKSDARKVRERRAKEFLDAKDLCRRLHSIAAAPYELVWEGFARTDANASPETIKAILNRLDVDKPWESIDANIPSGLHVLPAGATRANKLNAVLRELRDARNRCAHGSAGTAAPGWSALLEYTEALRAVAEGLVATLEMRLAQMPS